jgi:hypothetical protein
MLKKDGLRGQYSIITASILSINNLNNKSISVLRSSKITK